ncbi:hypothetical protein CTP10_R64370 (plasmid) [Cupriavidus sp. P-10]|uniref:hypothetical protein n=1 Tax=Cupriavidus sp. P-10 TaxID=2027911 RepID=UPI000E2F7C30|nr:hypothetical protein [Cupriavidus sp. P-10]BDB29024.1 hypothetical protein CTP10_R64370 [Cupriavidus sp. P-10]
MAADMRIADANAAPATEPVRGQEPSWPAPMFAHPVRRTGAPFSADNCALSCLIAASQYADLAIALLCSQ